MAADSMMCVWLILVFLSVTERVHSTEQGKWSKSLQVNGTTSYIGVYKTLYNHSDIYLKIHCGEKLKSKLSVKWIVRWSPCAEEYLGIDDSKHSFSRMDNYYNEPFSGQILGFDYELAEYIKSEEIVDCSEHIELQLIDEVQKVKMNHPQKKEGKSRKKRDSSSPTSSTNEAESPRHETTTHPTEKPPTEKPPTEKAPVTKKEGLVCNTWQEGVFLFVVGLSVNGTTLPNEVRVDISMKNEKGYLSAMEWPLLIFYGVMCIVYVGLGLIWLVLLACNWRDLLRVQFWIGGVIVLGMLEKAVFYADFQNINHSGESVPGAIIFAELVSCFKRTVARMLVIIVSLGFGIVKPRLGPMLHKVLGVGSLYFIFAAVEGCFRAVKSKSDQSTNLLLAAVPLALIDAIICWWIFTSLVQTLRTLRLRRNIVKLSLYRHFTNTLVFAVLASIAFMVWSYTQHRLKLCLTDWKELWVDDAYWHLLFSVILIVIMVLWRPTANNQRYAFSPLLDAAEDEADEDVIMSDAFEGMKMRGVKNGSPRQSASSKAEDDLKWVEENIPSTLIDKAIPGVIDSDEEIVTTKLEMAKME